MLVLLSAYLYYKWTSYLEHRWFRVSGGERHQMHVNCALCDKFLQFSMLLGMDIGFNQKPPQTKWAGPWWPVCTTLKMAATRIRKYHISAHVSTIFSCNATFYMFSGVRIFSVWRSFTDFFNVFRLSMSLPKPRFATQISDCQCFWQQMVTL